MWHFDPDLNPGNPQVKHIQIVQSCGLLVVTIIIITIVIVFIWKKKVYEVWLRDELNIWLSHLLDNLTNCLVCGPEKFLVYSMDSNPWPLRCRWSGLTSWAKKSLRCEQVNSSGSCVPFLWKEWWLKEMFMKCGWEMNWRDDPHTWWTISAIVSYMCTWKIFIVVSVCNCLPLFLELLEILDRRQSFCHWKID